MWIDGEHNSFRADGAMGAKALGQENSLLI